MSYIRTSRDKYYLDIAVAVAARGDCNRRRVGAVIVYEDQVWGTGYNGTPERGQAGCLDGACERGRHDYGELDGYQQGNQDYSNCIAVHAEDNALRQFAEFATYRIEAEESLPREKMLELLPGEVKIYVSEKPCCQCTQLIAWYGISNIHYYQRNELII